MLIRRKLIAAKAKALRDRWASDRAPINVYGIAKLEGLVVKEDDAGDDNLSGFLLVDQNSKIIGVNSKHPQRRRRFTVAHELGHFHLHTLGNGNAHIDSSGNVGIHFRDETSSTGVSVEEMEANLFAAELLMPTELIQEKIQEISPDNGICGDTLIDKLAEAFDVSVQAMTVRLSSLSLLKM